MITIEFLKKIKRMFVLYFFGGMLFWGLADGLRAVLSSEWLFYGLLERVTFIIISCVSYGLLFSLIGLLIFAMPLSVILKPKRYSAKTLGIFDISIFFSVAICVPLILIIGRSIHVSFIRATLAAIVMIGLFLLFTIFFIFVFQRLKIEHFYLKINSFLVRKSVLLFSFLVILFAVIYKVYDEIPNVPKIAEIEEPNVILISLDTLAAKHMSCYGYQEKTTPNLDGLAGQGILFSNVYSASKWTLPSHMSIMTSLYPSVHRVTSENSVLNEEWITLAEILSNRGYLTGAIVDGSPESFIGGRRGFSRGFDFYSHFPEDLYYYDNYERLFFWGKAVRFLKNNFRLGGGYRMHAEQITKIAIKWREHCEKKQPFFLFLHFYDIHADFNTLPYEVPLSYISNKDTKDCMLNSLTFRGGSDKLAEFNKLLRNNEKKSEEFSNREVNAVIAFYDAGIKYTDFHIGNLLRALEKLKLSDNTIIVVTSDHGEEFLEHGQFLHEQYYNEVIKVPLIIKWFKRLRSPRKINYNVRNVDIAPTILAMLGIPPPEQFQGKDLLSSMLGESPSKNLICYGGDDIEGPTNAKYVVVNNNKLIMNTGKKTNLASIRGQEIEVYDLDENVHELREDVVKNKKEIERLLNELNTFTEECLVLSTKSRERKFLKMDKRTIERLKALGYIR